MKVRAIVFLLMISIAAFSFTQRGDDDHTFKTGKYTVCYEGSLLPYTIELQLNDDFTYTYINNSNPKKEINVKGYWKLVNDRVVLDGENDQVVGKWKIDRDDNCLRSRNGAEFTRLCNC